MSRESASAKPVAALRPLAEELDAQRNGSLVAATGPDWLAGAPMDPLAQPPEPVPPLAGYPIAIEKACALLVGPTGWGRSMLAESMAYDGAHAGVRSLYLGHEVTREEFDARAASLARLRGHAANAELQEVCTRVRYLDLTDTVQRAMREPHAWLAVAGLYDVVIVDPLSAVASALGLAFSKDGDDYNLFYDRLIQPIVGAGCGVVLLDNVGHSPDAQRRALGASAKEHRADLTFHCEALKDPPRLLVVAGKPRSVRTPWRRGDEWVIHRDSQLLEPRAEDALPVTADLADPEVRDAARRDEIEAEIFAVCTGQNLTSQTKVYEATKASRHAQGKQGFDKNLVRSVFNGLRESGRLLTTANGIKPLHPGSIPAPSRPPGTDEEGGMAVAPPERGDGSIPPHSPAACDDEPDSLFLAEWSEPTSRQEIDRGAVERLDRHLDEEAAG